MKNFITLLAILFFTQVSYSQKAKTPIADSESNLTPGGLLDNVFDQYGNKYTLSSIKIKKGNSAAARATTLISCGTSSIFNLYFEEGSGMSGNSSVELQRRLVVCQLFQDISNFITLSTSPLQPTSQTKVNIWIRDFNEINDVPNDLLGLASAFYNLPPNTASGFGGIADNEIWKTIHTGVNSYTNVASPLTSSEDFNNASGAYYHGMVAINFNNVTPLNEFWNTNLQMACPSSLYDLYSVMLHEVTHALGFTSAIGVNGESKLGTSYNYYTRYDRFLKNNSSSHFLITPSNVNLNMYNYGFNSFLNTSILQPNINLCLPETECSSALKYVNANYTVPVYTPNCYLEGSSFSHFEDDLYPTCANPNGNNKFVMESGGALGITGRYLQIEERRVLLDIGYSVKNVYGTSSTFNGVKNYGGNNLAGILVAGVNDGITAGTFNFSANVSTAILINGPNVINGIISNDINTTGIEGLQDVYDATATINGVNSLTLTTLNSNTSITFFSNIAGLHLLRYVPTNSSGQRGNITYVYVYVSNPNCSTSACNIVSNGNFESYSLGQINCWDTLSGSPDIFLRNGDGIFHTGVSTYGSIPASDTHNGSPNDNFMGLYAYKTAIDFVTEKIQNSLSSPLISGQQYVLSFWGKVNNNYNGEPSNIPARIGFSTFPQLLASIPNSGSIPQLVPNSIQLFPPVIIPSDNTWHYYNIPFAFPNGVVNHNQLGIYYNNLTSQGNAYVFIDDVSIVPQSLNVLLDIPSPLCTGNVISDLRAFLSPDITGGNFYINNTILNPVDGLYPFNATSVGIGNHVVTFVYTNNLGCLVSTSNTITVTSAPTTPVFNGVPAKCQGTILAQLPTTSNNGVRGTWSPALNNMSTTVYTFTPSVGSCANTTTMTITINPILTPTFNQVNAICSGGALSPLPTTSINGIFGSWSPILSNTITTTYTFTPSVYWTGMCALPVTMTIIVNPIGSVGCFNQCPLNLTFTTPQSAVLATYKAEETITTNTNYLVNAGSTITLKAGNSITFSPKSEVKANSSSNFTAQIAICTETSPRASVAERTIEATIIDEKKVTLFPNPTNEMITISTTNKNLKKIQVFSMEGKMVFNQNIEKTNSYHLNVVNYQNGIYLAIIETDDGLIHREKIIKN